jgi:hypothetical protein
LGYAFRPLPDVILLLLGDLRRGLSGKSHPQQTGLDAQPLDELLRLALAKASPSMKAAVGGMEVVSQRVNQMALKP